MEPKEPVVEHLVVDSSVLIRKAQLKDIANNIYSVDGVIDEIKDENTRHSLQVLPFEFLIKQAHAECVKHVVDFSKRTGDHSSLSVVDINLIALSYQLCKEHVGDQTIEPTANEGELKIEKLGKDKSLPIAGFYYPSAKSKAPHDELSDTERLEQDLNCKLKIESDVSNGTKLEEEFEDDQKEGDEEEDEEDCEGWICPSNISKTLKDTDKEESSILNQKIKVACMTSDYSMQNVLLQLRIPVLSVDGLLIKKVRNYVLRCLTCRKTTTNMEKQFCPKCGYKTLERIVEIIDHNGNITYSERRKPRSTKGLKFALPMPKGGKHSNFPILSEDQPRAQNHPSKKALAKTNALDSDYMSLASPFAVRDVYSRSANLGIKANNRTSTRK